MGFQNANEIMLHGFGNFVIWLWKSFGKICKGAGTNPCNLSSNPASYVS